MFFDVYDTECPAGEVWLLHVEPVCYMLNMIADSSKPNMLRKVYTIQKWKIYFILYQNRVIILEDTNPFAIEGCKFQNGG